MACAGQADLVEREYPSHEFTARSTQARVELVRAAYLPRGVEFEVRLTNPADAPLHLDRDGVLLSFQGLEYPLDETAPPSVQDEGSPRSRAMPPTLDVAAGETRVLHLPFRLGRGLSEASWIVLRGLRTADGYLEPLWLEVPAVPSKLEVEPRKAGSKRGR